MRIVKALVFFVVAGGGVALLYTQFGNFIPENDGMPGLFGAVFLYGLVLALAFFVAITVVWLLHLIAEVLVGDRG
jgi:hypothetical protein